jgi:hypothetical protein
VGGAKGFAQLAVLAAQLTQEMFQEANPFDELAHKVVRHFDRLSFHPMARRPTTPA